MKSSEPSGRPAAVVTGASGFIGGKIAEALVDRGYRVRAVYRRSNIPDHLRRIERRGGELTRFDLSSEQAPGRLTDGCEVVVHAAAKVLDYGRHADFVAANVGATRRLVRAAEESGCRRFVFVSSISVHGFGVHRDSTESGPYYPLHSSYQQTKMRAENIVLAANGSGMETVAVRPGLVYGPGDTTTLSPFFEMLEQHTLPWLSGFEHLNCPIYIDDLVSGTIKAIEHRRAAGEVYDLASGERVALGDAVKLAAALLGVEVPRRRLSMRVARTLAAAAESMSAISGYRFRPPLTRYLAAQLSNDFHFVPEKARTELGFVPAVSWKVGLEAAVADYRERTESTKS